jgi:hypothetical protein
METITPGTVIQGITIQEMIVSIEKSVKKPTKPIATIATILHVPRGMLFFFVSIS